jgi:hypothetical protein
VPSEVIRPQRWIGEPQVHGPALDLGDALRYEGHPEHDAVLVSYRSNGLRRSSQIVATELRENLSTHRSRAARPMARRATGS